MMEIAGCYHENTEKCLYITHLHYLQLCCVHACAHAVIIMIYLKILGFTSDTSQLNSKEAGDQRETSAIRDELDMVKEVNDILLDKLRRAKESLEEAEARARELEKQAASLGEDVSLSNC